MNKNLLLALISSLILLLVVSPSSTQAAGSNPYCLGATGTFLTDANWPAGQTLDVACAGDSGTAGCSGHKVTLFPGQSYNFNNCTCAPYGTIGDNGLRGLEGGCIFVGRSLRLAPQNNGNILVLGDTSMPPGCSLTGGNPIACGQNGQVVTKNFTVVCIGPTPTPTPAPTWEPTPTQPPLPTPTEFPTPTFEPTPTLGPLVTPTPSQGPTPSACPVPAAVPNVRIICPNCEGM